MKFVHLHYFFLLWVIPLLIFFFIWAAKKRQIARDRFAEQSLFARLIPNFNPRRRTLKIILFVHCLVFIVIALARPRWGFKWEEIQRQGVDLFVVLDVSDSMLAQDIKPNRLKRAKHKIRDLLEIVEGDRIGLIAFAGIPFVQCPLTLDYGAVSIFLEHLEPGLIPVKGTAVGDAIRLATKSFDESKRYSKAIILITDGEDHLSKPLEAAKEAKKKGITIYTIGIGNKDGAPIPNLEGNGSYRKDAAGNLILSKIDEETLQKVALETGGAYVRSVTGDLDLDKIYHMEIQKKLTKGDLQSTRRKRYEERFQWFIAIALLFLLIEGFISDLKTSRFSVKQLLKNLLRHNLILLSLLAGCTLFLSGPLLSFENPFNDAARKGDKAFTAGKFDAALQNYLDASLTSPGKPELKYNIGNTYYKMKNYDEAEKMFKVAADGPDNYIKQKSFYNLGNTTYRQGKLQEALKWYEEALKLNPNDNDSRFNYEFVKEEIKKRMKDQQQRQQKQQKKENKGKENKQDQKKEGDQQDPGKSSPDQDKKKEEENKKADQSPEPPKDQENKEKQEKMAQAGDKKPKEQQPDKQQKGQPAQGAKISDAEAKKLLNSLDENREKYLKKKLEKMYGPSTPYSGQDW